MVIMTLESDPFLLGPQRQHDPSLDNAVINKMWVCVVERRSGSEGRVGSTLECI